MSYLGLASFDEICKEIGARLRKQRLAQSLSQAELSARAGVSASTIKALESRGQATLESLMRVVLALGLVNELQDLFVLKVTSIAEMERAEKASRHRAPRKA